MEGWNGGRGSSWSYQHEIGSNVSSSRSGTIVSSLSTAYASSGSRFSVEAAAMHFKPFGIHGDSKTWWWEAADEDRRNLKTWWWEAADEDRRNLIRCLVLEFFSAPSASCNIKRGDISVVEIWLKELGVGWVLSLQDGASAGHDARTWIRALYQITQTLCFTRPLSPDGSVGLPGICEEEGEPVADNSVPDRYHLALFVQETMLKILTFVDFVVAWDPDRIEYSAIDQVVNTKFFDLLLVHDALSEASNKIATLFDSPTSSVEVETIEKEMVFLLSAYKSKASVVIRRTMEKIRIMLMEDGDNSLSPLDPQGSSDIHKVTRFVLAYIDFLMNRSRLVNRFMQGHEPCAENTKPVDNMIVEMLSSLQEKLVNISESFSDQRLKLLFLLNNSYFILNSLPSYRLSWLHVHLNHQIESYMERYLEESWAPLLSCLCTSRPLWLGKKHSLLSKFKSEFQKICTTQMEWKVPDPKLRRMLRQAISDKIIPGYTEYIEDKKVTRPKITLKELKGKIQELFEG